MQKLTPRGLGAKIFHWAFIVVYLYALAKQLDDVEELEDFALLQYEMAFAAIFLLILIVRFVFMQSTRPTALPLNAPKSARLLARAVHLGMYVSLAAIAITGLWIGGLYWSGTKHGGAMDFALVVHELAVQASYVLVLGHVAAAVYRRRQHDGVWTTMVPLWRETDDQVH